MRISCPHCGRMAKITHRREISARMTEIYADCTNPDCYARMVFKLHHSHNITPPVSIQVNSLHEQIAQMDPQERQTLLQPYFVAGVQGKLF